MAPTPDDPEHASGTLNEALEQARVELDAMTVSAAAADETAGFFEDCAIHEVADVGRYAIPFELGWNLLIYVIRDSAVKIGFSTISYPAFDGVLANQFDGAALDRPSHALYPTPLYVSLRENIAAVRNFLMETYYSATPEGMTPESAQQALEEIATYLGDGLANYLRLHGDASRHDPHKPFIDLKAAAKGDGHGAQYLYEKILEMHRQSSWLRPFSAVVELFGGKNNTDWMLPPALSTPFSDLSFPEIDDNTPDEEIAELLKQLDDVEAKQLAHSEAKENSATVNDLSALGDQLVYSADQLQDVSQMSEPVRRDAVELAKEILRKLKVGLGEMNVLEGLGLKPQGELDDLGGIRGVVLIYERLLAWGRGIDASILQHPTIMAATQAIGQIGVAMKIEALRLAKKTEELAMIESLNQQMSKLPPGYRDIKTPQFAELLDRVERGIDTVLNRVQAIGGPGAAVGHSPGKDLGSYMSGTPIAGTAMQASSEGVTNRNAVGKQQAQVQEGIQNAARAQVQRMASQLASQQRGSGGASAAAPPSRGSASSQIAAMRQRLSQARRNVTTTQANTAARTSAQRAQIHSSHQQDDDHHHHHPQQQQPPAVDPMAATLAKNPQLMNSIRAMNNTTAGLTGNPVVTGRAAFDKMQKAATGGLKPPVTPGKPAPKPVTEEEKKKQQELHTPTPPTKGGGRGF